MDATLALALFAAIVSAVLFGATVGILVVIGVLAVRARTREQLSGRDVATPVPLPDTIVPSSAAPSAPASGPTPLGSGGLIGFFDDESSVGGLDGQHTELFQSKKTLDWGEEEEEGATEIFSAHSAPQDLAEFAFDEGEEATGRFTKGSVR